MKKNLFFISLFFLLTLISCMNNEVQTGLSDSVRSNADENINATSTTNNDMQQEIDKDSDNNLFDKYYDYISKEDWIYMVKGAMTYDKERGSLMDVDSAIRRYADDVIPADSIRKWWNEIPSVAPKHNTDSVMPDLQSY